MKQQTLSKLVIACVVLLVVFFFVNSSEENGNNTSSVDLFSDLKLEQVAKIRVEQGGSNIDLQLKDGAWVVPSRADYRADYGKVRGLILKLVGLNVSQRITASEGNFDKLGVTDKQVQAGKGLVKLYDTAGKELSGIYLGDNRKAKTSGMPISGQYVRRSDQQQVYLVPEAITVVTTLAYWLDSSLTNVMTAKIESVEQYAGAQAAAPEFTLVKDSKLGEAGRAQFSLKEGVEGDKKLKDVATTQIPSGLENLAIQDVAKAGEDSVKDLSFDKKTVYSLSNGLRYTVLSAEKGEKSFISLAVDFDSKLAAELKARADSAASAAAAVSSVASSSGAETSGPAASAAGNPAATGIASSAAVDPISNVEEAAKLNDQYKNWVYEVRKFQVQKFRYSKDQLFEAPLPASSAATSSIAPAASPAVKKK